MGAIMDSEAAIPHSRAWQVMETALIGLVAVVVVLQFGLFARIAPLNWETETMLVALAALSAPLHWALMHETIHGSLYKSADANRRMGRLLGIPLCLSWEVMRFGHLMHHGSNRHGYDRPEAVNEGGSRLRAAPGYFFLLLGGNELVYAVMPVLLALPAKFVEWLLKKAGQGPDASQVSAAALRYFADDNRRGRIRVDLAASIALVALAIWAWGAYWPVFFACLGARYVVLSLLDNAPHYGTPVGSGTQARNMRLAPWASWIVLNGNFHNLHHERPQMKWHQLRAVFARSGAPYEGSWIGAVLRQFKGPIELARE